MTYDLSSHRFFTSLMLLVLGFICRAGPRPNQKMLVAMISMAPVTPVRISCHASHCCSSGLMAGWDSLSLFPVL